MAASPANLGGEGENQQRKHGWKIENLGIDIM